MYDDARNVYKNNESRLDGEGRGMGGTPLLVPSNLASLFPPWHLLPHRIHYRSTSLSYSISFLRLKNNFFAILDVRDVSTGDHGSPMCLRLPDLIRVNGNRWRIVRNIKITKITNHKWNHRLSLVVRMEGGRTLQLEQHCRHCQEKFDKRHRELAFLSALHSHPFSLIMWASSIMNFPSLYFWLDSNACSWKYHETISTSWTVLCTNNLNKRPTNVFPS